MKKFLIFFTLVIAVGGSVAWFNRIELMLFMISKRTDAQYDIRPNREVVWQQGPETESKALNQKPNIIFIVLDDVGYNDISTFGGGIAGGLLKTPHIDKLASESVVFRQSYAGNATCAPSRGMMMTGRYQNTTGYEFTPFPGGAGPLISVSNSIDRNMPETLPGFENDVPFENQGLPAEEVTIAEVLKERGYYTAHIGKWHMGRYNGMAPNDQGFDDSLYMHSGLYLPEDHPDVVNAKLEQDPIDKILWARLRYSATFNNATDEDLFQPKGYLTDFWTNESVKVIKANKNRPFFLYLAHWGTHTPLQATRADYEAVGDIKPHNRRVYAAMMRAIDRSVGKIQQALEETGQADNTMIVFTSDNGGAGYVGLPELNKPFRGWKLTFFEGGLRVPHFIKWPNGLPEAKELDTPVMHIDIFPTLAAAAGAPLPQNVKIDGVNLLPYARGKGAIKERPLFFQSGFYRAIRLGDWKLKVSENPKKVWLYDLKEDPTEQNNLAEQIPTKVSELHHLIKNHIASGKGARYPYSILAPILIDKTNEQSYKKGDEYIYWPN
ncbi:sulfatase-like hydrolase/transferase [Temperatibacter marinus]|uniref:Sulfatase-like hydrolase/transferase n=1 Tax=Temperatibacter marinus TaxID=1456591 RepID=A0AA52EI91_9PROT|nr:sulfatase-like hydrolase/transferase [Temperatibacter marinus]WND03004.1 sulfatase-like hydrolase/transferase [Temperatibacter marinus]